MFVVYCYCDKYGLFFTEYCDARSDREAAEIVKQLQKEGTKAWYDEAGWLD